MSGTGKKTRGRQKIAMKKIENEDDRLITFSKRRSGIYKKASELATLCGAEVGFIVFSPAGKPFSFGHPSIESVANRFLNQNPPPNDNTHPLVEAHRKVRINQLTHHLNDLNRQLDAEKEKGKVLEQLTKGKQTRGWWDPPVDQLNLKELKELYSNFEQFRDNIHSKMNEKSAAAAAAAAAPSSSLAAAPPMDPSLMIDPFPTNNMIANEEVPAIFPPGYDFGRQQF